MNETISLLLEAKNEIQNLRRVNEILNAKVSTMELFATVLHTQPSYPSQNCCVDICYTLEKKIEQLRTQQAQ